MLVVVPSAAAAAAANSAKQKVSWVQGLTLAP
jgi:hypothetical protein